MLRLTEIGLFLLPFVVFGLSWWFGSLSPSPRMLAASLLCLVLLATWLVWFGDADSLSPDADYVPARMIDGRIVPGHAARQ